MTGLLLALGAASAMTGALALWFRWIQQLALEGRRRIAYAILACALALAVASFAVGVGLAGGLLAGATLVVGALWIALGALAGQSRQAPAVTVGAPAPDFTAPDHEGQPFRLSSLRGRPVLLKFFRGHW